MAGGAGSGAGETWGEKGQERPAPPQRRQRGRVCEASDREGGSQLKKKKKGAAGPAGCSKDPKERGTTAVLHRVRARPKSEEISGLERNLLAGGSASYVYSSYTWWINKKKN